MTNTCKIKIIFMYQHYNDVYEGSGYYTYDTKEETEWDEVTWQELEFLQNYKHLIKLPPGCNNVAILVQYIEPEYVKQTIKEIKEQLKVQAEEKKKREEINKKKNLKYILQCMPTKL